MRLEDTHGAPKFQHTVVLGQPQPVVPQPRDHIIWSLCSLVYGNPFCLGMLAVYFSIKVSLNSPYIAFYSNVWCWCLYCMDFQVEQVII